MPASKFETLVRQSRDGDVAALNELLRIMRDELRRVVHATRARRSGLSMRSTEVFNEAFLKLFRSEVPDFNDEEHLLAMWSNATKWVIIEAWRRKGRRPDLDELLAESIDRTIAQDSMDPNLIEQSFSELKRVMPREGLAAELRLLAGQRTEDIAGALGVSEATVRRWIRTASAWIRANVGAESAERETQ